MTVGLPRRRVLLVMNDLGWAGAEKQIYHLAAELAKAGNSVTLLAIGGVYIDGPPPVGESVNVVCLGAKGRTGKLRVLPAIYRHARAAEIVHCTGWDATLWGRIAAILARRPALFTEHTPGRDLQLSRRGSSRAQWIAWHNRILDRWTYAVVVVGEWQTRLLIDEGVKPEKIVRIPNAVPVDRLKTEAERGPTRKELGIPVDAEVLIHVARFLPQKGQRVTLRAVPRLREALGEVRVLFVGEGPEEEEIRLEAERLGADWASFMGRRNDVAGLMQLADLCVLPSSGEGLPMALIEAQAVGTPVVATDVGDIRWLLETTVGGLCVARGDEEGFVGACGRILGDPALRARLSRAAARGVTENFDAAKMARRYEEVFEAALQSASLPLTLSS